MHDCPDCGKPCQCAPGDTDPDDCVHDCESEDEDEENA
jgi:hypothetical protein